MGLCLGLLLLVSTAYVVFVCVERARAEEEAYKRVEKAMRTLNDAEACFYKSSPHRSTGPDRRFAYDLKSLQYADGDPATLGAGQIMFIDDVLASGLKEGYRYGPIGTCDAVTGGKDPARGFAYYAVPDVYPTNGRRTYIVNQEGVYYWKDQGNSAPPATWPDPKNDRTWTKLGE